MKLKNYCENPYLITENFSLKVMAILIPVTVHNVSTELLIFVNSFTHCYGKQSIISHSQSSYVAFAIITA